MTQQELNTEIDYFIADRLGITIDELDNSVDLKSITRLREVIHKNSFNYITIEQIKPPSGGITLNK
jgi:hypothetical protein